ncbi:DUS2 [Acrasis kona]|uniref:DUS2 n=1 Tax=Acrasis kona TaxID=1008807 RepID=A0AAW2ZC62_9EUKA
MYQTCPMDKNVVLQIGTACPDLALQAGLHMYQDYDALDVNMGCPVHFSTSGGMGSALLKQPEKIKNILTNLVKNIPDKSITCKIRLLATLEETLDLVKMIESTGVSAIAVHARYVSQRPREPALLDQLHHVVSSVSIPVIANGDAFDVTDFERIKQLTHCDSVMYARGALWNPSIFSDEMTHRHECARHLITYCKRYNTHFLNCKYMLQRMLDQHESAGPQFKAVVQSRTYQDLYTIFETHS